MRKNSKVAGEADCQLASLQAIHNRNSVIDSL